MVKKVVATKKPKKSNLKVTDKGKVFISATFNNTLITITNEKGETISWSSSGAAGFKGARKSTPFAATTAMEAAAKKAIAKGLKSVDVFIKGPGSGRDSALRAIKSAGLSISMIADVTPIPHNGPRAEKKRRV
ncbi:MAG: 30S ribosomal protein S11 [Candidatus Levybacteria bacterium RIFCSPLOWO2_01_FULL_36_13]|nr:MAG: 30S ribosomal protein S11 [Candidatus Levybacteria bacterium RIFCSPHIGHO2_01_FULL_36_15b]OGH35035.1 MAG: 30S ribosomal protein S11 [Candidatus Levybacteria bacterium RIFCSPLOWO2_01_FULL_36_13]